MKEREYFAINEESAERGKAMFSDRDYILGSATQGYKSTADKAYNLAEKVYEKRGEEHGARAWALAVRYSRNMAHYTNEESRIDCMCPSVLIAGPSGFQKQKKERQMEAYDRNHQYYKDQEAILDKIENILYGNEIIKSNDANAIELLEEKVEELKEDQERMKRVNAYYRKSGTLDGCEDLSWESIQRLKSSMASCTWERSPYPTWALSNNRQNLKRYETRLENLRNKKSEGNNQVDYEWYKVVENAEAMRIQYFFDQKPAKAVREIMHKYGFRWAPSSKAWQRQYTRNGKYAAQSANDELEKVPEDARWDK